MGWRHQLRLEAGRMVVFGGDHRFALAPCRGMGCEQPAKERSSLAGTRPSCGTAKFPPGCLHHTDRASQRMKAFACRPTGSQHCAHDYQKRMRQLGFEVSMSRKGNCWANAVMETFFKTLKAEIIWRSTWQTWQQATDALFQYINGFYNSRRRHSAIGGMATAKFEQQTS